MANKTVYPYGTGGSLPTSIGLINDLKTGGVDKALTAEQGKVLNEEINGEPSVILTVNDSDLSSCGGSIRYSDNTWVSANGYYGALIDVASYRGKDCKIYLGDGSGDHFDYAFVVSGFSKNTAVQYASGYSSIVSSSQNVLVTIPDNAAYLYVYMVSPGVVYTPKKVEIIDYSGGIRQEIEDVYNDIDGIILTINGNNLVSCGGTINNENKWYQSSNYYGAIIDVSEYVGEKVQIIRNQQYSVTYTFLTAGPSWGNTPSYATGYSRVKYGDEVVVTIPNDAVYLYVYMNSTGTIYTPSSITIMDHNSVGGKIYDLQEKHSEERALIRCIAPRKIRVVSYNIGHFSGGSSKNSSITSSNYESKLALYKATVSQLGADVMGLCEYSEIFGTNTNNQQVKAKDVLFGSFIPTIIGEQSNYSCNAIFTKTVVDNVTSQQYECNQDAVITHTSLIEAKDYYFIESDLYVHGERVRLVMTHLAFDSNYPGVLQGNQINELITRYASEERVILMGDWNVSEFSEFSAFTNAGYSLANDGTFLTYNGTRALDNIVVKGLRISNPGMITTTGQSDHYPFYCDVDFNTV